jgi:cardiolipin synthase (CMP-forming)
MARMPSSDWRLPPNWITLARLLITPLAGLALARGDYARAFPLLAAAALSDAFDGWLARRFQWGSELGEKLDPVADKLLVAVVFVGLAANGALPLWLTVLVLGRDAGILAAAAVLWARGRRRFRPTVWGKLSTVFQMTLGGVAVLAGAFPALGVAAVVTPLVWLTAFMTLASGLDYARKAAQDD